jgi:hypothetical protein
MRDQVPLDYETARPPRRTLRTSLSLNWIVGVVFVALAAFTLARWFLGW